MAEALLTLGSMLVTSLPVLVISCAAVAALQVYLTPDRIQLLLGAGGVRGYLVAVAVGIITPFSAASGLPLAAGLLETGVPLGIVTAFLVISPFISPVPILTVSTAMGWQAGVLYMAGVIGLGILTGLAFDRLGMARRLPPEFSVSALPPIEDSASGKARGIAQRTWLMIRRVAPYLALGIGMAMLAYELLPGDVLARYVGEDSVWALPLAALLGIPVINLVPVLFPISLVLVEKGVALGVVLTFSMAAAGLKLPESIFLARLLGVRVLFYLLAVVATGAMSAGYLALLAG